MTSTVSTQGSSTLAPVVGDQAERALLGHHEQRISDPLPVGDLVRAGLAWLSALIPRDRRAHRMVQLQLGLILYGVSDGMILMSGLGANPWDVFHQGLAKHIGLQVGTTVILVGVAVMLFWIPLRQKPGFGTLSNVVVVGLAMDGAMAWMPSPHAWWLRWGEMLAGVVLNGVATGAYIGAGMGPGPRDGVMTGYAARGHSVRVVRTSMELTVLASGWLLGGTVGIGTAAYALLIGPLAHRFIPLLAIRTKDGAAERTTKPEKRRLVAAGSLASENC
ncbi:putative membrane protein YczE [Catenulispora sp. EB89]|uniref:membrane protein YczE n=1 Tax=Catenulispora sp. EB89 TaxID=3156257 RepID=UPI0035133DDB